MNKTAFARIRNDSDPFGRVIGQVTLAVAMLFAIFPVIAQTPAIGMPPQASRAIHVADAGSIADWIRYPWSTLQGKAPPVPPPKPIVPVPDYPKVSFPILDSGFLAGDLENYWWIDNDRVMFEGYEAGTEDPDWEKKSREQRQAEGRYYRPLKGGFYTWDVRKNTVTLYRRDVWNFCYEDGEAYFRKLGEGPEKFIDMRGPLGKEREIAGAKPGSRPDQRSFKHYPCWVEGEPRARGMVPLRRDWGTIVMGVPTPQQPNDPVLFIPPQGDSIVLPILRNKWGYVIYAPWRDRYLLVDDSANTTKMPEVWWLLKDGRTEAIPIPHTGYQSASFLPVKPGIVMTGYWRPGVRRPEEMFLLADDGSVSSFARAWRDRGQFRKGISPNGCRVAFSGNHCDEANTRNIQCFTAQMIDFCEKGETK